MDPLERFVYSQSSLQDYVDCRRRFQLRYVQRIAWPALQAAPARENEQHIERGARFHRLAHQFLLGIPEAKLTRLAETDEDANLLRWWENFTDSSLTGLLGERFVEVTLSAPLDGCRLRAKYDLVVVSQNGLVMIFDWKTAQHRPRSHWLRQRLQSRVYPFLMVAAGRALNHGRSFTPEQVEMIYWFAEPGQEPERIAYNHQRWQEDGAYLRELVHEIQSLKQDDFCMSDNDGHCGYCVYRSLCTRGVQAAALDEDYALEADERNGLFDDLEQVAEIGF